MPKQLSPDDIREFEEAIVPKSLRGKHAWPIEVEYLGAKARLRLLRGRKRIYYDWPVPDSYRGFFHPQKRFLRQVPAPTGRVEAHRDPGRNPQLAIAWLTDWLREQVLAAEASVGEKADTRPRTIPNDVSLQTIVDGFRASRHFTDASTAQQTQWSLWLDYFLAEMSGGFRMNQVSYGVLRGLHEGYQRDWTRTSPDGRTELVRSKAGHNTAAKVVRFFGTVCEWALSEPYGEGLFLLDTHPFARIRAGEMRKLSEHSRKRRSVTAASDDFTAKMLEFLAETGRAGQALLIFGTEAALGRRPGEVRTLRRCHLLTTEEEIAHGLERQRCREVLTHRHVPQDELSEAAAAYAARGWAVWFTEGKQAARFPDAVQYDRVVPLGRELTALYRHYMKSHWEPLGLGVDDYLFPAWNDRSRPTSKSVAMKWFKRAKEKLDALPDPPKSPQGSSHTLRHRFRAALRKEEDILVAFVGGWSLRQPGAMNQHYLPVSWRDIVEFIDRVDETTARTLAGVVPASGGE